MKCSSVILGASLVLYASTAGATESIRNGDWVVDNAETFIEAYTVNPAGKSVGFWCSKEEDTCFFYLRTNTDCEDGVNLRLQAKTEIGAVPVDLLCHRVSHDGNNQYLYFFADSDNARIMLEERHYMELVLPDAGKVRFSLKGSKLSIRKVGEVVGK